MNDRTVTDEIRLALEARFKKTKSDPTAHQSAESVRAGIEREAATKKRDASAAILADDEKKPIRSSSSTARALVSQGLEQVASPVPRPSV